MYPQTTVRNSYSEPLTHYTSVQHRAPVDGTTQPSSTKHNGQNFVNWGSNTELRAKHMQYDHQGIQEEWIHGKEGRVSVHLLRLLSSKL